MSYHFDEAAWPPPRGRKDEYEEICARGRVLAARSRVVVCGLARDVASVLPRTLAAVEAIGALFSDYRAVFFENDSVDDTLARLRDWAGATGKGDVLSEKKDWKKWPPVRDPLRCNQMAYYRECCRQHVAATYPDFDFVVVLDTDLGMYSIDGIANSIGWRDALGWTGMASNGLARVKGRLLLYDVFAFRTVGNPRPLGPRDVNGRVFARGTTPLRVYSAFGGLAVYEARAFAASRYVSNGDCEHVGFHAKLSMWLNPSQVVLYP